jgi:hypothetical protein
VPLLPIYSSARYLYLPSVGYAAVTAILLARLINSDRRSQLVAGILVLLLIMLPAWRGIQIQTGVGRQLAWPATEPQRFARALAPMTTASENLYILNFPGSWLEAQFLPAVLTVLSGYTSSVHILSQMYPLSPASTLALTCPDQNTIEVAAVGGQLFNPGPPLEPNSFAVRETLGPVHFPELELFPNCSTPMNCSSLKLQINQQAVVRLVVGDLSKDGQPTFRPFDLDECRRLKTQ